MDYRLVLLLLVTLFAISPLVFFSISKNNKNTNILFITFAILYSFIVCVGVFSKIQLNKTIATIHFEKIDINKTFSFNIFSKDVQDFTINILMFIPLGFLLTPIFKKFTILKTSLIGLIFAIFIEVMQLVLPIARSPQLSDIILNFLSCLIGIVCFVLFKITITKLKKHKKKTIN